MGGVCVSASLDGGGFSVRIVTTEQGSYLLGNLRSGDYQLEFERVRCSRPLLS